MQLNVFYNIDCFEGMKQLDDDSIDYAFTSPPYNRKRNDKYTLYDDTISNYYTFLKATIDELRRICRKHVFINVQANYYNKADVYRIIGTYAKHIQNIIIWEKSNPMPCPGKQVTNAVEYFLAIGDSPLKGNRTYIKNHITTSVNSRTTMKNHKAVMNKDVALWFIGSFIPEGSTIIDPFMGTGTTAIVAAMHNCDWIGFEMVSEYCEIAKERFQSEYRRRALKEAKKRK